MPQMSSMDATYHSEKYIIYAIHNPVPEIPLVKLGNVHKEALNTLSNIFRKANPPAVPPRVPVRELGQKKLQEMNQEVTQIKMAPQSKPIKNAEPLRVTIVDTYTDELQPLNQSKKRSFSNNQKPAFNSYTKN